MTCKDCIHYNVCEHHADELRSEGYIVDFNNRSDVDNFCCEFKQKQEWISVDERLPEPNKLVLCIWERVDDGWNYGFARYQREDVWYVSNEGMPRVTHWMPLPMPPKMKGDRNAD